MVCSWMKPETRNQLFKFLETKSSLAKLSAKATHSPEHPEVEDELFEWFRFFRRHEKRKAVIATGDNTYIQGQALNRSTCSAR